MENGLYKIGSDGSHQSTMLWMYWHC